VSKTPPTNPSIDDVARRAGVSTATVSRALRGLPNVASATRATVEFAAKELGYHPDPHASRLASGRASTVGVIAPYFGSWYAGQVLTGIEAVLRSEHLDFLITTISRRTEPEEFRDRFAALTRRVDGIITIDLYPSAPGLQRLIDSPVPVVSLGDELPGWSSIRVDDARVGEIAAAHLARGDNSEFAIIRGRSSGSPVEDTRVEAFTSALAEFGHHINSTNVYFETETAAGGASGARRLLDHDPRATAVFCLSDEMAIGALAHLQAKGLRTPSDISVLGVDDHELAAPMGLSTIHQPVASHGVWAAEKLLALVADPDLAVERRVVEPGLIVRSSTR